MNAMSEMYAITKSGGGPDRTALEQVVCRSEPAMSSLDRSWVAWLAHDLHHRAQTGREGQNRVRLRSNPAAHELSVDRRCMHSMVQRRLEADPLSFLAVRVARDRLDHCSASSPAPCREQACGMISFGGQRGNLHDRFSEIELGADPFRGLHARQQDCVALHLDFQSHQHAADTAICVGLGMPVVGLCQIARLHASRK